MRVSPFTPALVLAASVTAASSTMALSNAGSQVREPGMARGFAILLAQARSTERAPVMREDPRARTGINPSTGTRSSMTPYERDYSLRNFQIEQGQVQRQQLPLQIR